MPEPSEPIAIEGYFGTRQIRTDRRLKLPRLVRTSEVLAEDAAFAPGETVWFGVVDAHLPVIASDRRLLADRWRNTDGLDDDRVVVRADHTFSLAGGFFADYTPPGYASLPPAVHPPPVPPDARLQVGQRVHFIRQSNSTIGTSVPDREGAVYTLMDWEGLDAMDAAAFARLLPTYHQWSTLLDNITFDETMDNPGLPGQILRRAIDVFDHTVDGPYSDAKSSSKS